jgi:hypothetical protein
LATPLPVSAGQWNICRIGVDLRSDQLWPGIAEEHAWLPLRNPGDVVVVDPEHILADFEIGQLEEGRDALREEDLLFDPLGRHMSHADVDISRARADIGADRLQHLLGQRIGLGAALEADADELVMPNLRRLLLEMRRKALDENILVELPMAVGRGDDGALWQVEVDQGFDDPRRRRADLVHQRICQRCLICIHRRSPRRDGYSRLWPLSTCQRAPTADRTRSGLA